MSKQYRVIGPCPVADVEPGGMVSQEALEKAGALIEPLLGVHLEGVAEEPTPTAKTTKSAAKAEVDK